MPLSDSHVKFDRNGVSYVDYDDLRKSPGVKRQLDAARRMMETKTSSASAKAQSAGHGIARRTKR